MGTSNRYDLIDCLRGLAILEMFVFHYCFLLYEFNLGFEDFLVNPYWRGFRIVIVTSFLTLVGVSLRLSVHNGWNRKGYLKRLLQLFLYGLAITIATYLYQPGKQVVFGILQFILVASVFGMFFVNLGWRNLLFGIAFILLGMNYSNEFFNQPGLYWLGMTTRAPYTLDYVPLLPWFGAVLIGIFIGSLLVENPKFGFVSRWRANDPATKTLALMGRHSLNLYMAHVPAFMVIIYVLVKVGFY